MKNVFLIGFMGSGKTTFGKKLAARMKRSFTDLDEVVSQQYGKGQVSELIDEKGLDFFRVAERECLRGLKVRQQVISTGGGTPCYFDNLEWMKANGLVVFLNPGTEVIFSRLKTTDLSQRPLLKNLDEKGLLQFIRDKMQERLPFYERAHIIFNPVKEDMQSLLAAIDSALKAHS